MINWTLHKKHIYIWFHLLSSLSQKIWTTQTDLMVCEKMSQNKFQLCPVPLEQNSSDFFSNFSSFVFAFTDQKAFQKPQTAFTPTQQLQKSRRGSKMCVVNRNLQHQHLTRPYTQHTRHTHSRKSLNPVRKSSLNLCTHAWAFGKSRRGQAAGAA